MMESSAVRSWMLVCVGTLSLACARSGEVAVPVEGAESSVVIGTPQDERIDFTVPEGLGSTDGSGRRYDSFPELQYPNVKVAGLSIVDGTDLNLFRRELDGLGIQGGAADVEVNGGEGVSFYLGPPAVSVILRVHVVRPVTYQLAIKAEDAVTTVETTPVRLTADASIDVTAAVDGVPISAFQYRVEPDAAGDAPGGSTLLSLSYSNRAPVRYTGDVNQDGVLDVLDALLVAQSTAGLLEHPVEPAVADVNCDERVDVNDAQIIARLAGGLIDRFPCNVVNFRIPDGRLSYASSVEYRDFTLSALDPAAAPGKIVWNRYNGIGVAGSLSDLQVDGGERVSFAFHEPMGSVMLYLNTNAIPNHCAILARTVDGTFVQGEVPSPAPGDPTLSTDPTWRIVDVSAAVGYVPILSFDYIVDVAEGVSRGNTVASIAYAPASRTEGARIVRSTMESPGAR